MSGIPYSEGGLDQGMFRPSVLKENERSYFDYVHRNNALTYKKFRQSWFPQQTQNTQKHEVLYSQSYIDEMEEEISALKAELNFYKQKYHKVYDSLQISNANVERLDAMVTDYKSKFSNL
ncbi:hypothetical protein [Acinetobacter sp. Marseille-Q1618]|uniref:hypothetical protein n=1 Tax=Acinetobacter sp. Marseille-Q1618 TaxID=2697502 RepID=UPI0015715577|nr:hypothetical protein [Acinetobacter sp. Marseille-Q1618]